MPKPPAACGTYTGYQRHKRAGEEACEPCRAANAAHQKAWRAGHPSQRDRERQRTAARSRALWRLADLYPNVFRRLYLEELRAAPKETT